ncbi:MAG: sensory histidine kinase AtoS [Methanomassiliicoccales archaeon PtaU1.Bin124]|nr:MAG: sensory histidine kinase AtoS [Methanomassiliicoccales archaeon PtaU1.Bin124]
MDKPIGSEKELEELRKEMQSFSYSISHDFQAPVRRIIGMGQILKEDHSQGLDDKGRKYLDIIVAEATRMNEMIGDLLIWSRANASAISKKEMDLSRMVKDLIDEQRSRSGAPEIVSNVCSGLRAEGDPALIETALRELVDNAVKFSDPGKARTIEFGHDPSADGGAFFIRDEGVGFDMSHPERLFKPFQRFHGAEFPGDGMGLAIASLVIRKHGGRIWARSDPGKGTTIFFALGP